MTRSGCDLDFVVGIFWKSQTCKNPHPNAPRRPLENPSHVEMEWSIKQNSWYFSQTSLDSGPKTANALLKSPRHWHFSKPRSSCISVGWCCWKALVKTWGLRHFLAAFEIGQCFQQSATNIEKINMFNNMQYNYIIFPNIDWCDSSAGSLTNWKSTFKGCLLPSWIIICVQFGFGI